MLVTRVVDGVSRRVPDDVVVEEPLEIRLDGNLVATTMRTPGHDYELAVGFCHAEGLLGDAAVRTVRYCALGPASEFEFNVVTVETGGQAPVPEPRLGGITASCGLCGAANLVELSRRLAPLGDRTTLSLSAVAAAVDRVQDHQELFARTGGLHAAAVFDATGAVDLVREDIGRHNAVDKIVGRRVLDGCDAAGDLGLFVSGRASFEMVQKAWAAGFGTLVAVSAPSALAIDAARAAGMTLAGFARGSSVNVYSGEIATEEES